MFEWNVDTPLSKAELAMAVGAARAYQQHRQGMDIRPDLFTLDREQLEAHIRELQMMVFRLAMEVEGVRRAV